MEEPERKRLGPLLWLATRSLQFWMVLVGLLLGAWVGHWLAYVPPKKQFDFGAMTEARVRTAERRVPFVATGCIAGSLAGIVCERWVSRRAAS